ncbi:hypothetical protein BOX15_Mlig007364g1, partial [Macrostomum lignano]
FPCIATMAESTSSDILTAVDELHSAGKEKEARDQLKAELAAGRESAEIYWRLARECRGLANRCPDSEEQRKALIYEAFESAKKGLAAEPDNWSCHKWMGILLDLTGRFEGTKKRIENSFLVKEHFTKALDKKPDDAVVLHCLGVWCYEVANLSWLQRNMAAAFFAKPPTSTYEEALEYLLRAEKASPNFYASNLNYIGKAYYQLKKLPEAKEFFQKTINHEADGHDDREAKKEAASLMKKC